ncbi:uncharacterized protein METZ01_LOCUS427279, partial [marine metagenome]
MKKQIITGILSSFIIMLFIPGMTFAQDDCTETDTFIDNVENTGHDLYTTPYVDDPVTMEVLEGTYKLYGNFEIQNGSKIRMTVDGAESFNLNSMGTFSIESEGGDNFEWYECCEGDGGSSTESGTFIDNVENTGHDLHTTPYVDGPVRLEVLDGAYKLYGNFEIQD